MEDRHYRIYDYHPEPVQTPKRKKHGRVLASVLAILLIAGGAFGVGLEYGGGSKPSIPFYEASTSISDVVKPVGYDGAVKNTVDIVEMVGPSIVGITSKVQYRDFFNNLQVSEGAGSGVIFNIDSDDVYIMTNNHVVADASELLVELSEDNMVDAEIVGKDAMTDLAIIKVSRSDIPIDIMTDLSPVVLGDSDKVKVGETAIAIGNPLGYNNTVTVGVISAIGREVSQNSLAMLQTDAAINPGNSGGALVNNRGEVIGINSVKISDTSVEGIGFAIPINEAKPIVSQIIEKGYVARPFLGISGQTVDEQLSEIYGLPLGIYVASVVPGAPAEQAGLVRGDMIIGVNGVKTYTWETMTEELQKYGVGDEITLTIVREGPKKVEVTVKLADRNDF
ncbi:S1C family serine protease [Fusibacter sp. JL216-2]|uniref:S1C family serine protease n=1 Tax=Fusibacter sp. JL216-2 TaxID=3071453 RepID=UPI003D32F0D0